jgi:hypothetical protein
MMCVAVAKSPGQDKKPWRSGTVLEVKTHEAAPGADQSKQYDITVKVGKKIYLTLYSPKDNEPDPAYYVGMARTVQVDGDTLRFNDLLGHTRELKIVSSKDAPSAK